MKQIICLILFSLILSACAVQTTDTFFFGQLTYTEKTSLLSRKKYPFNPEEKAREPLRRYKKVVFIKDSTTQITYTWKERKRNHIKYGKFYHEKTTSDTSQIEVITNWLNSDYLLSGKFLPPDNAIPYSRYSEKGLTFLEDGSCIHAYQTNHSDSPSSSFYQNLGEYKILNDTLHIVFFLGKNYFKSHNKLKESNQSFDVLPWRVIQPYQVSYVISSNNDTLRKISKDIFYPTLVAKDTSYGRM